MEPKIYQITAQIHLIDWIIIALYFLFSIGVGLYYTKRATKSTKDYFASGQGIAWWLLGTSMVATTFAADTPLAISGLIMKQGIAGNWFWWCQVPIGILGVFFFSRLWRRSGIITDTELINIRYSGRPAKLLRGFRALYFAIPYNCLVIGWVNLAMANIMALTFNFDKLTAVLICFFITMVYSAISGLWGVMVTDFFQFILALGMAVFLAIYAVNYMGGMDNIIQQMYTIYGDKTIAMTSIFPINSPLPPLYNELLLPVFLFLIYIGLVWWTTGNTDGGAYLAQRMLSAKNEKHAFLGYLWFNIAHYCIRPWPWIVVGLVAAVMFPGIADPTTGKLNPELGYIAVMLKLLPSGLLGLMLASFLAAYMSTISTQLNWGASYLINDFYRPFIKKDAGEKHYVIASVVATVIVALIGAGVTFILNDIFTAWLILSAINAGVGIVYLARWYWWRVNAWSEITAILACIVTFIIIFFGIDPHIFNPATTATSIKFPVTLLFSVPVSLILWVIVTFLTKPTDENQLIEFYKKVHPGGLGWKKIADKISESFEGKTLATSKNIMNATFGIMAVYCALIGVGELILGKTLIGTGLLIVCILCAWFIIHNMSNEKWES